jgi:hypothetical protein
MADNQARECSTCFFTDKFPGVVINENSRCNHCNSDDFRKRMTELTTLSKDQLMALAEKLREERKQKGARYDCIIGASGGLDSSYVIYLAKKVMNLNPLVVSYTNDFTRGVAKENLKKLCDKLGVELRVEASRKKFDRKHIRSLMRAFRDVGSYWGCCEFCGYILDAVIYKHSKAENITTMLGSTNLYEGMATQYLSKKFKNDFMLGNIKRLGIGKLIRMMYHLMISQYYYNRFRFEFGVPSRISLFFDRSTILSMAPGKKSTLLAHINKLDLTQYVHWNVDEMVQAMAQEAGWKSQDGPYLPMRFDCILEDGLIDRTYKNATGLTIHTIMCNNLIYGGVKTKKDLAQTASVYEGTVAEEHEHLVKMLEEGH